jgi:uncharacterized membrane protein
MKILGQLASLAVLTLACLWAAAVILPRLLPTAGVIFALALIGRVVWFYTRRW